MALAMLLSNRVFPALGGDTMSMRWPLPMGENMSTIRQLTSLMCPLPSRLNFSSGKSGVRKSKGTRSLIYSVVRPFTDLMFTRGKYLSPSRGGRISPVTVSPLLRALYLICCCET